MIGSYKGAQVRFLQINSLAIFSHSLNLCGAHAAAFCIQVASFFGTMQKLYNIFGCSPQRWEIPKNNTGCSLKTTSNTRWSTKIESVKPFAEKIK